MRAKLQSSNNLFKKAKSDSSNSRSTSLLPWISKICEKVIHNQRNVFLKENNLLYNY